ncbi:MAG TPA: MBL fold metallo-hydrolase [Quisquiliibacterium sp.]|nr:MBL fold metallo-hydrolase [Quisquiliibacterium sp.]
MRFCSLGSGSEGNALLIECGAGSTAVRLLIDCGFGMRELQRRLQRVGLEPRDLSAMLITHEHGDHVDGAPRLAAKFGIPLHMTCGTALATGLGRADGAMPSLIDPHRPFEVGGVRIEPVPVPHDAREPVQFVIDAGGRRLGVLTDLGRSTPHVLRAMSRLDALVLECNHDEGLLRDGNYPAMLKRRIAGDYGHLANAAAAHILGAIDQDRLRTVVAAHLSRSNNSPELARAALSAAWGCAPEDIVVADQDDGFGWIAV